MPGLVTSNGEIVRFDGQPVAFDLQAALEAATVPSERTLIVPEPVLSLTIPAPNLTLLVTGSNAVEHLEAKDPDSLISYSLDWSTYLGVETIVTSEWEVPAGLTLEASSKTDTTTTVSLSGGTVNTTYRITNTISTSDGTTADSRSFLVRCQER